MAAPNSVNQRLIASAEAGDEKAVTKLIDEEGADVNYKGAQGRTAVYWAVNRGHHKVVELLLSKGADVEAGNSVSCG